MTKKNLTFYEFSIILRGYIIKNKNGFEVSKYELYHREEDADMIVRNQTKYNTQKRKK